MLSPAQYSGPAVEACRGYAAKEAARFASKPSEVLFERDQDLVIERYTAKVGSQFVSSVLLGNGAVVFDGAPSAELSFLCLLANERQPVFFHWLPRQDVRALIQCARSPALRAAPTACLSSLLLIAEQDLLQISAQRFVEARQRDTSTGREDAAEAYRKSGQMWLQYRDAECARRAGTPAAGISAEDARLGCQVDLTRRRVQELR